MRGALVSREGAGAGWGSPEGAAPRPMREVRRLIGTPVSERSDATMRRSWSAAARQTVQHTRCLSWRCSIAGGRAGSTYARTYPLRCGVTTSPPDPSARARRDSAAGKAQAGACGAGLRLGGTGGGGDLGSAVCEGLAQLGAATVDA